jgi:hypothetical protein
MFLRALIVWFAILVIAFVNGGLRQAWLIPMLGDTVGRALSTVALCAAIVAVSWYSVAWIGAVTRTGALQVGLLWFVSTVGFEFLVGHYLLGTPWKQLLADYNVLAGRLWVLVLVTAFVAPLVMARSRNLLRID